MREYLYTEDGEPVAVATIEETAELIAESAKTVFGEGLQEIDEAEDGKSQNQSRS